MVFSSMLFAFSFLVICYGAYFILGKNIKTQNVILLISSLIFYAWGGPILVLLLCLMTFVCWGGAIAIEKQRNQKRRSALCIITCATCLSLLFIFKYTNFLLTNISMLFGSGEVFNSIALPIGISFYTFQLISYVIDVKRHEVEAEKKYWVVLLYASLFHQCIAGPIVRYQDVANDIHNRQPSLKETSDGFVRFAIGLAKKAILANGCAAIADSLIVLDSEKLAAQSSTGILLGIFCYALQIYLDFSAYSDMAIGMGLMIGFHYKENFNYPYIADSVTDFWRRWHISLSTFFRDYVYIPLGGNRVSIPRHIFNLFVVWALTGFWHGASWNYLIWGLYFFGFLMLEKFVIKPKRDSRLYIKIPKILLTMLVVYFGWMIFKFEDMSHLLVAIKGIFCGNGNTFTSLTVKSQFTSNIFFLILATVACTPILPTAKKMLCKTKIGEGLCLCIMTVAPAILIILSAFTLAGDTYNPFLYFQF